MQTVKQFKVKYSITLGTQRNNGSESHLFLVIAYWQLYEPLYESSECSIGLFRPPGHNKSMPLITPLM